jgi:hypothetical protein
VIFLENWKVFEQIEKSEKSWAGADGIGGEAGKQQARGCKLWAMETRTNHGQ